MSNFKLKSGNMKDFIAILSLLSLQCSEIIIKNNKIRQTSDSKTIVFDVDLTNICKNDDMEQIVNMVILNLKSEVEVFNLFISDDEVKFETRPKDIEVSTAGFNYSFQAPNENDSSIEFLDKLPIDISSLTKLVSLNINEINIERINKLSKQMKTESVGIIFDSEAVPQLIIESANRVKKSLIDITDIVDNNLSYDNYYMSNKFIYIPLFPFLVELGTYINVDLYMGVGNSPYIVPVFKYPGKFQDDFTLIAKGKILELQNPIKKNTSNSDTEKEII